MLASRWLEVALNGPWTQAKQPGIPVAARDIVEQAVACAAEGAAIVHFHAYDASTGRQRDTYELYAPVIEAIRARADVVCYPTLPLAGTPSADDAESAARFAAVEKLAAAGLVEWAVVDPGSVALATFDELAGGREGLLYTNPPRDVRCGLRLGQRFGTVPSYAVYEPGFTRLGHALHAAHPGAPRPVYRFMFSDQFSFGLPPEPWALDAHLRLLRSLDADAAWMVAGLGVRLDGLAAHALALGGHLRTGLEDAPLGCGESNVALVRRACRAIEAAGCVPAPAAEIRAATRPHRLDGG
jgi:3-keto-5-aminohexanoate cleavage enzyme